jgi:hypothetical protein
MEPGPGDDPGAFRDLPGWTDATENLRRLTEQRGAWAEERGAAYAAVYQGRRAAMVFDVVVSRQRRYIPVVLPLVERFSATPAAASLEAFAHLGPQDGFGLMSGEARTMQDVSRGLLRFCERYGHDEESGVSHWAAFADPFEHAPKLDPYLGSVKGIGLALFAYMRMRSGADAIKPDVRVRKSLGRLGFRIPAGDHALLLVAQAAAREVGLTRLALDQLLWATN